MKRLREFLKRILPPPVRSFMREVKNILKAIGDSKKELKNQIEKLSKETASIKEKLDDQNKELKQLYLLFESANRENLRIFIESKEEREQLRKEYQTERQQLLAEYQDRIARYTKILENSEKKYAQIVELLNQMENSLCQTALDNRSLLENAHKTLDIKLSEQANELRVIKQKAEKAMRSASEAVWAMENSLCQTALDNRSLLQNAHKTLDIKLSEQANELRVIKQKAEKAMRSASEAVWAEVFNSAIKNCSWLKDVSLSLGRWAVGYPYLYVMFRILNELRPKSILEFGLGQSTRMIAQYAAANKDVKHYVVEHDKNWIEFFGNDCILPENTEIVVLDYDFVSYKEAKKVRIYKGASMVFQNMKFDYISIDGPLGGDMDSYSRIDILNLLPDCLKDSFIIMLDDYNRLAEQNTGREIERILKENGIAFKASTYYGDKDIRIWCSQDLAFYCSL